jgi:hydrogenase-4 component E
VLISCGIVVLTHFTIGAHENGAELVNPISVVLIGFFFMISRKKVFGQIIGFLVVENGLSAAAMFATGGMPLVVDLGVFVDLITAVLVMGFMVFRISDRIGTTDTDLMRDLKG